MHASSMKPRNRTPQRWWIRAAFCVVAINLFYASPVFLAATLLRVALPGESAPESIRRVPGPWGDAYLLDDGWEDGYSTLYSPFGSEVCSPQGGHEGIGDGKCPDAMAYRWASIPVWSSDWLDWLD